MSNFDKTNEKLYTDDGGECELTLNAKYSFEK